MTYEEIRVYFILHGTSLWAWCKKNHVTIQYVKQVVNGKRKGKSAEALLLKLKTEMQDNPNA